MKKITIVWIILLFVLITGLTIAGLNIATKKAPYKKLELQIVDGMKIYYGQDSNLKKLPSYKKTHKVTLDELEAFGIDINNIIDGDTCDGYGIVTGEKVSHNYKAYIKCSEYTTKGY